MTPREFLKRWLPKPIQTQIRKFLRHQRLKKRQRIPLISLAELESVLTNNLKLAPGDTVFVHSSFSDLKMDASPEAAVSLLLTIIGKEGNLLMPFYPLKGSYEWLLSGKPFDLREPWTSMGALPTFFARMSGVRKSIHPTKSVAVWGKDQKFLISDHHKSAMPYGHESPYFRITQLEKSKIVGLGVTANTLSAVHAAVDTTPDYPIQPYHPQKLQGVVIDYEGRCITVTTYAHNLEINNKEDVPKFFRETHCPTYKEIIYKRRPFFVVDAKTVIQHTTEQSKYGKTFFYPRRLNFKQPPRIP